ncbi:hypothetical protein B0H16DRAFT_1552361 [Mycena metata]|uniref:Uncharacterized protein n=1 Tax=Mycena metata TaxID=1033252 RepID=A0AAD7IRG1_9AGAR|nr:hypothetical protein B0H16DRAFT_1552361 [Mycena metata]
MSLFGSAPLVPAELCMSLQISVATGPQSQSFEEVRVSDYLSSYRSTGRRPDPFPQLPADARTRAMQGLPPLFVPAPFPDAGPSTSAAPALAGNSIFGPAGSGLGAGATQTPPITDPARLPPLQAFLAPVAVPGATQADREAFVAIVAAPEYSHWSPEELRYHAYLRGARIPPPTTQFFPFGANPAPVSQQNQNPLAPSAGGLPVPESGDTFMSITARPEFAGHSVEELRVSFLRTGAELTSAQIFTAAGQPLPPSLQQHQQSLSQQPTLLLSPPVVTPTPISPFAPQPQPQSIFGATQPQPQPQGIFGAQPAHAPGLFSTAQTQQARPGLFSTPALGVGQAQTWGTPPAAAPTPTASGGFSFGAVPPPPPLQQGFSFGGQPQQPQQQQQPTPSATPGGFSFGATATPTGAGGAGFAFGGAATRRF